VEQDGARGVAVAAGAADLLVKGLDGAGKRDVDDGADVGLVDAHAEGDGGDDDLELAGEEVALDAVTCGGVETSVVRGGAELLVEARSKLFGGLARGSVDDRGARCGVAEELLGELGALQTEELEDLDGEVGAAEAGDKDCRVGKRELANDVALHGGCGGGGEGDDGAWPQGGEVLAERPVVGAEVVPPLRDAVGFIDGDERGRAPGQHLWEAGNAEALGGDEKEV